MKVSGADLLYLQFVFLMLKCKENGAKADYKMLVKITAGVIIIWQNSFLCTKVTFADFVYLQFVSKFLEKKEIVKKSAHEVFILSVNCTNILYSNFHTKCFSQFLNAYGLF